MTDLQIPFSKPYFPKKAINQIKKVMDSNHPHGDGQFSKMVEGELSKLTGTKVFLTASCTQALEVATLALDLKPGEEVIIPSYTFPSGVTSLVNYGVKPVFCDISLKDMNIDVTKVEALITSKTKAISYVNYAGYSPDINSLREIAFKYDLQLIEHTQKYVP